MCGPAYQQVALGATVTFTATGGNGSYSWGTQNQGYLDGPVFTWQATTPGPQSIFVTSGGKQAACQVNVVGGAYYPSAYNYGGGYPPQQYAYKPPHLPNTGFAPHTTWQYALAALLLASFGLTLMYVGNALVYRKR
jgi:hypothetical protein